MARKRTPAPRVIRRWQPGEQVTYRYTTPSGEGATCPATVVRVLTAHPDGTLPYLVSVERRGMLIVYHGELQGAGPPHSARPVDPRAPRPSLHW